MKRLFFAVLTYFGLVLGASAQGTLPVALSQQMNLNGIPMAGALLYTYVVGTVATPQNTYQDTGLSILNPWPLSADQNGRLPMFYMATGSVHARLTDSSGVVQFDYPSMLVIGAAGGGGGGTTVDPTTLASTGDVKIRYDNTSIAGWVRENGLTIGNSTSGATERANADTQSLFVYLYGKDPNLVVSGGRTGNALNDYNASKTIALPDMRGRVAVALADMGNSASGTLPTTYCSSPTTLGFGCGSASATLALANLPPITSSGSNSITVNAPGQIPYSTSGINNQNLTGGGSQFYPQSPGGWNPVTSFSGSNTIIVTSTGTSDSPFGILQPSMLYTFYVKL